MRWYHTTEKLSETNREVGLRFMTYDRLCSHAMLSRVVLVMAALVPFVDVGNQSCLFFCLMLLFFMFGAIAGCSWNSWIKDIVPSKNLGAYFSQRLARATFMRRISAFPLELLRKTKGAASKRSI